MKPVLDRNGFTLMEVIVVVAIISTLTGMMIPFIYRIWESNEIDRTRECISGLKKAMAGDPHLIQNGIRTNFGFAGDNGQLPRASANPDVGGQFTVSDDLVTDSPMLYPNWKGPYMAAGYDPSTYKKDAWGRHIVYTVTTVGSRRVSATLKSAGPDGVFGNADDISDVTDPGLQISDREIIPTDSIQGNLNVVVSNAGAGPVTPAYTATVSADYWGAFGLATASSACISLTIGQINAGEVKTVAQNFATSLSERLPIGKVVFRTSLFPNGTCSGAGTESVDTAVFIPDGLNAISLNLPVIHHTIP